MCKLRIKNNLPKDEPIYTVIDPETKRHKLYEPTSVFMELPAGGTLHATCPGEDNAVIGSPVIGCTDDAQFAEELKGTSCKSRPIPAVRLIQKECGVNGLKGVIHSVGYAVNYRFLDLYDVCYNYCDSYALYAFHKLNGRAISGNFHQKIPYTTTSWEH